MRSIFMPMTLVSERAVTVDGIAQDDTMPLSWADGMIGAFPVFSTYEEAVLYSGSTDNIIELEQKEPEDEKEVI